jgi:hypothetical protein
VSALSVSVEEQDPQEEPRHCRHDQCRVEGELVDAESGYCFSHDPRPEIAARREAARKRAGESTARKYRRLDPDDFGPLETPADAQRWAAMVARALLGGQLSAAKATAIRSLLAEWRSAHASGEVRDRLEQLEKATKKRAQVLR